MNRIDDTVEIYASMYGGLPRFVTRMTREEWLADKPIPRESPLTWGQIHPPVRATGWRVALWKLKRWVTR